VIGIDGKLLEYGTINYDVSLLQINCEDYKKGMYIINLVGDNKSFRVKFIKE
jgi:hypothetical protein